MKKFSVVILLFCTFVHFAASKVIQSHGLEIREIIPEFPETLPKFLVDIDLSSCICQDSKEECQIGIAKSTVLEINCSKEELFCCSGNTRAEEEEHEEKNSFPIGEESRSIDDKHLSKGKVNMRLVQDTPTPVEYYDPQEDKGEEEEIRKKCKCKARDDCPQQFIDYRFTFHCSHNTTRCCEPEEESRSAAQEGNCDCLPKSECLEDGGEWRLDDKQCPGDLRLCCGAKDEYVGEFSPIPLPQLKIPSTEAVEEEESKSLQPPPPLPTFYNYQSPKHYSGYYNPYPQQPPRPLPQSPPPRDYYQQNIDQGRTLTSDSFYDSFYNLFNG